MANTEKPKKNYQIVQLDVENMKRARAISITPVGKVVEITGENEQGKSSVLDAMWWLFSGVAEIQRNPISDGASKALVRGDLGDLLVTRTFERDEEADKGYTTKLTLEHPELGKLTKAQDTLSALIGDIAFDPLEFANMRGKEQYELLRSFVPNFDFAEADRRRKEAFEKRTTANSLVADLESQAKAVVIPDGTPEQPVDESALVQELAAVSAEVSRIEREASERRSMKTRAETLFDLAGEDDDAIERLKDQIKSIEQDIVVRTTKRDQRTEEAAKLADEAAVPVATPPDVSEIQGRIENARSINAQVAKRAELQKLIDRRDATAKTAEDLSAAIKDIDAQKQKAVSEAKMPVDGIGFGDGFVTLGGQPFEQASTEQQLIASVMIAAAANPRLRVLRVKEGAFLDKKHFQVLAELAEKLDFQVWIETVSSDRPGAFVIENGHLKGQPE